MDVPAEISEFRKADPGMFCEGGFRQKQSAPDKPGALCKEVFCELVAGDGLHWLLAFGRKLLCCRFAAVCATDSGCG